MAHFLEPCTSVPQWVVPEVLEQFETASEGEWVSQAQVQAPRAEVLPRPPRTTNVKSKTTTTMLAMGVQGVVPSPGGRGARLEIRSFGGKHIHSLPLESLGRSKIHVALNADGLVCRPVHMVAPRFDVEADPKAFAHLEPVQVVHPHPLAEALQAR